MKDKGLIEEAKLAGTKVVVKGMGWIYGIVIFIIAGLILFRLIAGICLPDKHNCQNVSKGGYE